MRKEPFKHEAAWPLDEFKCECGREFPDAKSLNAHINLQRAIAEQLEP